MNDVDCMLMFQTLREENQILREENDLALSYF